MRRREFITLLGGAAAAWPLAARAQQFRRIGVLVSTGTTDPSYLAAFVQALRKFGWIDGQNLRLDIRWHENDPARARAFATELVAIEPDVILTASSSNLAILHGSTRTIPVVFLQVSDPVVQGFITSLARPGAISRALPLSNPLWAASGSTYSNRSRRILPASLSCSTHNRRNRNSG